MNLQELREAFRRDTDDRGDPYLFPDADINDWLNEAQREACIRGRLLFKRATLPVTKDNAIVPVPKGWFEIRFAALKENGSFRQVLVQFDEWERDRLRPCWRSRTGMPDGFVLRDGELDFNATPGRDMELFLEGYSLPSADMEDDKDEPEIDPIHHPRLVYWAMFRGYSVPDKEMFDPGKAADQEQRFEYYFGRDPKATLRKPQSANNPHHNKCWW